MEPLRNDKYVLPKRIEEPVKGELVSEAERMVIEWYREQGSMGKLAMRGWLKTRQLGFLRPFVWRLAILLKFIKKPLDRIK